MFSLFEIIIINYSRNLWSTIIIRWIKIIRSSIVLIILNKNCVLYSVIWKTKKNWYLIMHLFWLINIFVTVYANEMVLGVKTGKDIMWLLNK